MCKMTIEEMTELFQEQVLDTAKKSNIAIIEQQKDKQSSTVYWV